MADANAQPTKIATLARSKTAATFDDGPILDRQVRLQFKSKVYFQE
jgi:hypothetical protein